MARSKTPFLLFVLFIGIIIGWLAFTFIKLEKRPGKRTFAFKNLYGTMISSEFAENAAILDEVNFDSGEIKGKIVLRNLDDILAAEVVLESAEQVTGKIEFNQEGYNLFGTAHLNENFDSYITSSKNSVDLGNKGENNYLVLLRGKEDATGNIAVTFSKDGNVILTENLDTSK